MRRFSSFSDSYSVFDFLIGKTSLIRSFIDEDTIQHMSYEASTTFQSYKKQFVADDKSIELNIWDGGIGIPNKTRQSTYYFAVSVFTTYYYYYLK